jgi:methionine-gamma-lyase
MTNNHSSHKRTVGERPLRPESLMMGYGYDPVLSEGALKCPIFMTSTFVFRTAEEGKAFFELAYGLRKSDPGEEMGLIYSRLNNPDLEILEDRLTIWDEAEAAAVFESGMAAISTTLLAFLSPGDVVLHSEPIYGGTDYLLKHILPRFGIRTVGVAAHLGQAAIEERLRDRAIADRLALIYLETPANPSNALVDMAACAKIAKRLARADHRVLLAVDNTFLGPLWQHPLQHGVDLVLYSATKYIGGHSDVIAGVCLGSKDLLVQVKAMRTMLGTMASPMTGWMLLRSLETLKLRMTSQMKNARRVAGYLAEHPKVQRVYYLGHLTPETPDHAIYHRQCLGPGSMIAFDIVGGEAEAFRFLNALQVFHLAVSLGGTESLAEHPASMTHSDVDPEERIDMGIGDCMVRLSIGVEHPEDLIADLEQALACA